MRWFSRFNFPPRAHLCLNMQLFWLRKTPGALRELFHTQAGYLGGTTDVPQATWTASSHEILRLHEDSNPEPVGLWLSGIGSNHLAVLSVQYCVPLGPLRFRLFGETKKTRKHDARWWNNDARARKHDASSRKYDARTRISRSRIVFSRFSGLVFSAGRPRTRKKTRCENAKNARVHY